MAGLSSSSGHHLTSGRRAGPRRIRPPVALLPALLSPVLLGALATGSRAVPSDVTAAVNPRPEARLARGKFIVASRQLLDPNFAESVILLVDYDDHGALGVVVNRPTEVPLTVALPDIKELRKRKDRVYLGGPVGRDRMVLLLKSRKAPPESVHIFDTVYASGSLDALRHTVSSGDGVRAYAGYAGWGAGQLDAEVARGDWLIGPADPKTIFELPPERAWPTLFERFIGDWADVAVEPRFAYR